MSTDAGQTRSKVGGGVQTVSSRSNIFSEQRKNRMDVGQKLSNSVLIPLAFEKLSSFFFFSKAFDKVADLFKRTQHSFDKFVE